MPEGIKIKKYILESREIIEILRILNKIYVNEINTLKN